MIDFSPDFKADKKVVACNIVCGDEILMLLRADSKTQGNTYGPPAGKIGKGESVEEALKREVKEETGLEADMKSIKFIKFFNVKYDEFTFSFEVYNWYVDEKPQIRINRSEHKSYIWIKPQKALELDLVKDQDSVLRDVFNLD